MAHILSFPKDHKAQRPRMTPDGVTRRDSYIVAQALYRFIATEQVKPDRQQQWSNLGTRVPS
jgi:hypothetical protein